MEEQQKIAMLNCNEAPAGFIAIPKKQLRGTGCQDNICNYCDYRLTCAKSQNAFPCMSETREDGVGVYFKKRRTE